MSSQSIKFWPHLAFNVLNHSMLVTCLWKSQIISIEYLMAHFESSFCCLLSQKLIKRRSWRKAKKNVLFGVSAVERKTYKYFLVEENRNH